jgi:hypothetical protein
MFSLAFGMMMGTVPTSIPQIILMSNWLLEGKFLQKWSRLRTNKYFWALSSVFLVHLLGLLWTENSIAGADDARTKIPLMFLPLLLFSTPALSAKEFRTLLYFFILGCVCNTAWSIVYSHVLHHNEVVRNASRFMSHIRLGLFLNMGIAVCVYLFFETEKWILRGVLTVTGIYLLFSMYALGLASGFFNFALLLILVLMILVFRQEKMIRGVALILLFLFTTATVLYIRKIWSDQLAVKEGPQNHPQKQTAWGTPYIHFDNNGQKENGNFVLMNIQLDELKRGWTRIFPEDSFNFHSGYNIHRYEVLIRYLSSLGLNKDSAGIVALSNEDLQNIRKDIFNFKYPGWSFLHRRMYEFANEYDEFRHEKHVNGHSVTMRFYFWSAALHAIKKNIFFGVGTGDVQSAMNSSYAETYSPLRAEWYKRPHNQFLTVTVSLGVCGLIFLLISLLYPLKLWKSFNYLYWPFFVMMVLSFLTEDTLETQAGLSFCAFFNSLFISRAWQTESGGNPQVERG